MMDQVKHLKIIIQIVAAVALTALIVALLPSSGGNVIAAVRALNPDRVAIRGLDQVTAHLVTKEGGHIDKITLSGSNTIVEGWAMDETAKRPAKSVQIFVNGTNAGSVVPRIDRPDVAKAFGIASSPTFGFRAIVPGNVAAKVRAFAEDSKGSFVELRVPVE
jgi:hypothetical protein